MEKMKALTVVDVAKFELQNVDVPTPKENEVLVKVAYCGICGSDLPRYFEGGVHAFPQVLGHEFSGEIVSCGESVVDYTVGEYVVVAPLVPLTNPQTWIGGNPAMAEKYSFIGSRQQGAMAEYVAVPATNLVKVPKGLDLKKAAVVEPLTVAIHGVERVAVSAGAKVLVFGAGTIGLLTVAVLRARGVGEIISVDLNENKLKVAQEVGADTVINPLVTDLDNYFSSVSLPDVIIETAGSAITQKQAIKYIGKRGKVVYVGTMTRDVNFEPELLELILRKEILLTGAWMSYSMPFPGYEWETALRYLAQGDVNVDPLLTGEFRLEEMERPFELMVEKNSSHIKLMYKVGMFD